MWFDVDKKQWREISQKKHKINFCTTYVKKLTDNFPSGKIIGKRGGLNASQKSGVGNNYFNIKNDLCWYTTDLIPNQSIHWEVFVYASKQILKQVHSCSIEDFLSKSYCLSLLNYQVQVLKFISDQCEACPIMYGARNSLSGLSSSVATSGGSTRAARATSTCRHLMRVHTFNI